VFEKDNASGVRADQVSRIKDALAHLEQSEKQTDLALPGYRLHALKGDLKGFWSVTISGNWRLVFRFEGGDAFDVDLIDYHQQQGAQTMPMNDAEAKRVTRVLNGRAGISPEMAIRLEKAGSSNADHWLRLQTAYDLAQARMHEREIKVRPFEPRPAA
jgi:toxin HigB-1